MGVDEARFYLSLNGPELAESNFVLGAMQSSLDRELRAPLRTIAERVAAMPATIGVGELPHYLARIDDRLRFFCEPEHFSAHELARILRNLLGFMSRTDTSDGHVGDAATLLAVLRFWAERMQIFMPGFAADLVRRLSAPAVDTAELARAMRHQAIAGRP